MLTIDVRRARFEDEVAVQNLCQRNGLEGERSDRAWEWIWGKNRLYSNDWQLGWVLESDENIVGFIGNIPRAYSLRGREWIAGVARAFVVDELFRTHSLKLIAKFFQQKEADLLIFSSANSDAEAIYRLARASCIPQQDYNKDLFWIVSPTSFIVSLLRKKGIGELLATIVSLIISPLLSLEMLIQRRWSNNSSDELVRVQTDELTNEMDEFWRKKQCMSPDMLLSYRDREAITWQFTNDSAKTRKPVLFTMKREGELYGYVIITRADSLEFGLRRMMITDLIVLDDDPVAIRELIKRAFLYAKENKIDVLQMIGFPSVVRSALHPLHPFTHTISYNPFWYYVLNPDLKDVLQNESVWYASTFDGDSSI